MKRIRLINGEALYPCIDKTNQNRQGYPDPLNPVPFSTILSFLHIKYHTFVHNTHAPPSVLDPSAYHSYTSFSGTKIALSLKQKIEPSSTTIISNGGNQ